MQSLDPRSSALVLIDLQKGIVSRPLVPYAAPQVLAAAGRLTERFRELGGTVVLVRVGFSADGGDVLRQPADLPMPRPAGGFPPDWMDLAPELGRADNDILIIKRQWGAFYGTELDLQLRRRGIDTIVLGGVATSIGVESTARAAFELGYALVFAEDAMSGTESATGADLHAVTVANIFPRLGLVRKTEEILAALS
jgi:nicotinamidase-related amidase